MNICHCGIQMGYPHAADCPFPLYNENAEQVKKWYLERMIGQDVQLVKGEFNIYGLLIKQNDFYLVTNAQGASVIFSFKNVMYVAQKGLKLITLEA